MNQSELKCLAEAEPSQTSLVNAQLPSDCATKKQLGYYQVRRADINLCLKYSFLSQLTPCIHQVPFPVPPDGMAGFHSSKKKRENKYFLVLSLTGQVNIRNVGFQYLTQLKLISHSHNSIGTRGVDLRSAICRKQHPATSRMRTIHFCLSPLLRTWAFEQI